MQITEANVGDILLHPGSGKRFKINAVGSDYVEYTTEMGDRYATREREINALKVTDPFSIEHFENNEAIGRLLNAAEHSALGKILSGTLSPQEMDEAVRALGTAKMQQKQLDSRITKERADRMAQTNNAPRLSDLISSAEQRRNTPIHSPNISKKDLSR